MKGKIGVMLCGLLIAGLVLTGCGATSAPTAVQPTAMEAQPTSPPPQPTEAQPTSPPPQPTETKAPSATTGASIAIAIPSEVLTFDPQLKDNVWTRVVLDNIYESLLWRDNDGNIQPLLAEKLPQRIDDTTWRFVIRRGISFTNGEPLNAEAVAASVERIIDPEFNSELMPFIETITTTKVVDEYTVDIITSQPDILLPARIVWVKIVPPKHSQDANFAEDPVGTGSYVWVSGSTSEPITLKRNPDYWGGDSATVETVVVRAIEEVSTRIAALNAGEVDLVTVLPPDLAETVPKAVSVVGVENPVVVLNAVAGLTKDVRVRHALNLAVDKEAIATELFAGYAQVAKCQAISPQSFGYNPNLEPYPYDPEQARALLEEAGAVGETITFVSSEVFPKGREIAEVIAAYWRAIGLEVDLQIPEFNAYIEALYATGEERPGGVYLQTSTDLLDADRGVTRLFVSDAQAGEYVNEKVDTLAQEARVSSDPAVRQQKYFELSEITCEEAPLVYLINPEDVYGTSTRLQFQPRFDSAILFAELSVTE
jgi:peptide/nickel transport system substrate-binding protein